MLKRLAAGVFTLACLATQTAALDAADQVTDFTLDNGMQVVVIEDHRAPVVVHMVWYRAGAADEEPGVSGIAHFLEHLMFKATDSMESGSCRPPSPPMAAPITPSPARITPPISSGLLRTDCP